MSKYLDDEVDNRYFVVELVLHHNVGGGASPTKKILAVMRRNSLSRASNGVGAASQNDDALSVISDMDDKFGTALDDEAREVRGLARKETLKVQILRLIVAVCILGAGITISIYTYRVLKEEEEQDSAASVRDDRVVVEGCHSDGVLSWALSPTLLWHTEY